MIVIKILIIMIKLMVDVVLMIILLLQLIIIIYIYIHTRTEQTENQPQTIIICGPCIFSSATLLTEKHHESFRKFNPTPRHISVENLFPNKRKIQRRLFKTLRKNPGRAAYRGGPQNRGPPAGSTPSFSTSRG